MNMNFIALRSCRCLHTLVPSSSSRPSYVYTLNSFRSRIFSSRARLRVQFSRNFGSAEDKRPSKSFKNVTRRDLYGIISLAFPYWRRILGGLSCLTVSSAIFLSAPRILGKLIDEMDNEKSREIVADDLSTKVARFCKENLWTFLVVFLLGSGAIAGRLYLMHTTGQLIVNSLRTKVFNSVLRQDMQFFDKNKVGEMVSRLSSDAYIVGCSMSSNLSDGARALVTCIGSIGLMVHTSSDLSMSGAAVIPIIVGITYCFGKWQKKLTVQMQEAVSSTNQLATERLSNVRTVRIFAAENKELQSYKNKIVEIWAIAKREAKARGLMYGSFQFMGYIALSLFFYRGSVLISQGVLTYGDLSSFMIYTILCATSISNIQAFYAELMRGLGASARLFELRDLKPTISIEGGTIVKDLKKEIRFESVAFSYPNREPLFNDVTFRIPASSITAIVGSSGSGKSTIAHLLLRLYAPSQGRITVDGIDLRELDPSAWRRIIGTVSQEPVLFSTTIRDNILYGVEDGQLVTEDHLCKVAEQSNCLEFIRRFPNGFDTVIGEHGSSMLSGGQRQRIAIARALIKKPRLLILDEATSALDATSEYLVRKALDALLANSGQTVFIIAHRLSTIKHANQIIVLDKGTVAEFGAFEELIQIENGIFRQLFEKQTVGWRDDQY